MLKKKKSKTSSSPSSSTATATTTTALPQKKQLAATAMHVNEAFEYVGTSTNLRNPEYGPPMSPPPSTHVEYATVSEISAEHTSDDHQFPDASPDDIESATYAGLDAAVDHSTYASTAGARPDGMEPATYAGLDAAVDHSTYASTA